MANFCCSIETEPRTLNEGQLNYAREIAVDIVQKKEVDEVSSMLNEKPVAGIKETAATVAVTAVSDGKRPEKAAEECMKVETSCQCSTLTMEYSPQDCRVKEPLSAPF